MHAWMAAHKPYDPEMKHDEAMKMLNADFDELSKVSMQLDTAIADVTATIENHRKSAAELLAKKPVKKGAR
jgi:prefoldin subunit 5